MYRVLCDGLPIYDLRDEELVLLDPKVTLEVNTAGSFDFKLPPGHPQYDLPKKMKSLVEVWHDNEQIFAGRPVEEKIDFYNCKYIECEGQLAYLNDSIQRPAEYHDKTVRGYLETLIDNHNKQVDESKQFEVGIVTVTDNNDSLFRYTNHNTTLKEIKEDLVDDLGGYLRVRNHNGHRYIDYIAEFDNLCSQSIQFGENLLDYAKNIDIRDIATAIIPLGARLETSEIAALEERLTIKSVNNGKDYLAHEDAVKKYGFVVKTVTWDNVTTPEMLKSKGQKWLTDGQFENMVLEVKAVDLHYTDEQIEQFKLFDMVLVHSAPHGLDKKFPLSKMTVYLDKPASNTFTLGTVVKETLSDKTGGITSDVGGMIDSIPIPSDIVKQAVDQATALITAATRGNIVTTATEQLIMDTKDVNTAKRVWRWNLNGLGYSNTGYNGTYATAITMDGQIVGQRIAANSISGEKLDITYKTSVTKEIADAEEAARQDAVNYTDGQLKNYYTKSQIETSIKNTKDAVLLSAKETAEQYVDGRLKNYSTSAQIKVTTDAISSEVSKKLNSSELGTKISQNAYYVRLAWNGNSKYIQFEGSALNIYDTGNQKLMSLTYNGSWFYYKGTRIGKIGTNNFQGEDYFRGLVFDLEYDASYMCWAAKDSSSGLYNTKLIYYHKAHGSYPKGLHFNCNTYCNGYLYLADDVKVIDWSNGGCGIRGEMTWCNSSNTSCVEINGMNKSFKIYNNVDVDIYSNIDMHNWDILNQSDARMKKNIQDCSINALELLNNIELKEFDWIQSNEHEPIGIIAQQLQEFAPELVEEKDGHLSIKTMKLIFYLIKAVQELSGKTEKRTVWQDPYTLLDKKVFCAKMNAGSQTREEKKHTPMQIPIRKG
jgi:hypothetical protein